ncbi:MAG: 50S ribosomal protein L23 [Chlamydiae bacterium]|nr:50S ribosomal protein L23 [Chlamydiota bacterium]
MNSKNPYHIIQSRYITEKAQVLQTLHTKKQNSNPSLRRCENPKYVFLVDKHANKNEIARAIEVIYADAKIKVVSVNTIRTPDKPRWVRGREGVKPGFKKAIVTLEKGDVLPDNVK